MKKCTLPLLIVIILIAYKTQFAEAWPFGDTDEKLTKIVEFIDRFQKDVIGNDKRLRETIDQNMKTVEDVLNELQFKMNEVILNVNRLLEGRQMLEISLLRKNQNEF